MHLKIHRFPVLAVLAILWLCQSCSVTTMVHFNKDYSGDYSTEVDLSEAMGFAAMADTTGKMDQQEMISRMRDSLNALNLADAYNGMSGIRDAKSEVTDEGKIVISFKFDNIDAFNASFKAIQDRTKNKSEELEGAGSGDMDMLTSGFLSDGTQMFTRNNKTLTYSYDSGEGGGLLGGGDDADSTNMDMISSMIDYTINLSFDRKVKSVDVSGASILEKTDHEVKTRVDFGKLLKNGKYTISVKTN